MKKISDNHKIILCLLFILLLGVIIVYLIKNEPTKDEESFKKEYESLNGQKYDNSDIEYISVSIPKKNYIIYSSFEEIFNILDKDTGVIFFGFPECPWCRILIPRLIEAVNISESYPIYYLNCKNDRDIKELVTTKEKKKTITEIKTTKEGTENYYKLVEKLNDVLGPYQGLEDESIKRLYFPTIIFVKDGKIVDYHIGTLESQTDYKEPLTEEQNTELIQILKTKLLKIMD